MHLHLRPGNEADVPNFVSTVLAAFSTNPIHQRCLPRDSDKAHAFWRDAFTEELKDPNAYFLVVEAQPSPSDSPSQPTLGSQTQPQPKSSSQPETPEPKAQKVDEDGEGVFVGFAKWNYIPADTVLPPLPDDDAWPAEPKLATYFFGMLNERHAGIMGGREHWYLELVCTKPEYMGRGAGKLLVNWGCQRADERGVEAYLDSTPDASARGVYEKFGFRTVESASFDEGRALEVDGVQGGYVTCFMLRSPMHVRGTGD
ncbi:acyl-CoA N-acyltransferase [Diplogelasinospora grovesii]|uniref:Acyl-CoA N-acyltransferase n=1 Tax=Diplogelasinospora grovesii TaxID=303347 RepID=A0AAN6S629_9PEZI|nr:acyl-CoA N-acyltransferase [Diplogelasinospora grovesii]